MFRGSRDAGLGDKDADDHLEAIGFACGTNVLETRAVGGIDADRGEAFAGDDLDVGHHFAGSLARAAVFIWGVGDGPLVARATELTS